MSNDPLTQTPAVIVKEPTWTCITLNQSFQNSTSVLSIGYNLSVSMAQFTFVEVDGVKTYNVAVDGYTSVFNDATTTSTILSEEVTRADGSKITVFGLINEIATVAAKNATYPAEPAELPSPAAPAAV